ncbi:type I secretion system permease/ATPase [Aminivibrio sp.]
MAPSIPAPLPKGAGTLDEENIPWTVPPGTTTEDALAECLLFIARHHDRPASRDTVLSGLPLEGGRLSPSVFSRAAEKAGFGSRYLRTSIEGLNTLLFPVILILDAKKACVLLSLSSEGDTARVFFPELGKEVAAIPLEELRPRTTGYAVYVWPKFRFDERTPDYMKPKDAHWFWSAIAENRGLYRDVLLASLLSNIFALAMPLFVMNIYNRVIPNRAVESLWVMAVGVGIMLTADFVLHLARGYLVDRAGVRTNIRLSSRIMEKVLGLKTEARPASVGSFANSVSGFESVRNFISSATLFTYVDLPFALFFLVIIAVISWPLAIPLVIGAVLILFHTVLVQGQMRELAESTNRASALKNATLVESLVGMETLKTQGAEGQIQVRWEKAVSFLELTNARLKLLSSSVVSGTQWVQQMVSVATMIIGVYLVISNSLNMGGLIAAYMLSSRFMAPIGRVAGLLLQYYTASRSLAALDEIMKKPTERPEETSFLSRPLLRGNIEFSGVTFSYPEQERPALSNVSFRIEEGEKVAFIGRIGSGKTTVGRLLLGLYGPQEGSVFVDGTDIRQIDPSELRRNIGTVPQDAVLFFGTLRENILFGNPGATDSELLQAVRIAGVDTFVQRHPKGFDLSVGERGDRLSSGQRQAVALARAVLRNPPILLLDEPTASMDQSSEERIRRNIEVYGRNRTLLLVTHRSALLSLVDRLILLDGGRVVADGPKDRVLSALSKGMGGESS